MRKFYLAVKWRQVEQTQRHRQDATLACCSTADLRRPADHDRLRTDRDCGSKPGKTGRDVHALEVP